MQRNSFWIYRKAIDFTTQYRKFFILDFEATCEKHIVLDPQEIIEFPCLAVDTRDFTVVSKFHQYVKPVKHPEITPFCTSLTGISQHAVDNSKEFPEVLDDFKTWLNKHYGENSNESIFVTCGNWDLRTMLPNQCQLCNLEIPHQMKNWINLKTAFFQATGYYPRSLFDMASRLGIKLEGKLHSGIDDCTNMRRIIKRLSEKNFAFQETDSL
ncbi:ERI1 exoribonuclease 3 [Planococcus citri]|uniref:ERI1 exoribonuclease 3 n=1 Tax=Planococcus citri TaxID=170843 RepID=UPI0031F8C830